MSNVPNHVHAVTYSRGEYALQLVGHDTLRYRLDGEGRMQITQAAPGVQLLRGGRLQSSNQEVINPYPNEDALVFVNAQGLREIIPMTSDTHRIIRIAAENNGAGIPIHPLTGGLDRREVDGFRRAERGKYDVIDAQEALVYSLPRPDVVIATPDQSQVRPGGRGGRGD